MASADVLRAHHRALVEGDVDLLAVVSILGWIGGPHPPIFGDWPAGLRAVFSLPLVAAVAASNWICARGGD